MLFDMTLVMCALLPGTYSSSNHWRELASRKGYNIVKVCKSGESS